MPPTAGCVLHLTTGRCSFLSTPPALQTIQESMRLLLMVRAFQVMGHYAGSFIGRAGLLLPFTNCAAALGCCSFDVQPPNCIPHVAPPAAQLDPLGLDTPALLLPA